MLDTLKDTFGFFGSKTTELAKRVGPRRGIIAGSIMAAAIGTSFVVRYLRQRAARAERMRRPAYETWPQSASPTAGDTASVIADAMTYGIHS